MNADRLKKFFGKFPTHIVLIGLCLIWLVPVIGLLVTSFRPVQDITSSGWWTVLSPPQGSAEYTQYCSSCHGADGKAIANANLSDPKVMQNYRRSITLMAALANKYNGKPHMGNTPVPKDTVVATIGTYLRR